jgi:hypothetical protein
MDFRVGVAAWACLLAAVSLQGCGSEHLPTVGVDGEMVDEMKLATMQKALESSGACPIIGDSVHQFMDGAPEMLAQSVKESLAGPCLNLTSPACGAVLVNKSTDLMLWKVEKIIGLQKARTLVAAIRLPVLTIQDKVGAANCQVSALDGATQADGIEDMVDASKLEATKTNVAKLKKVLSPLTKGVEGAQAILGGAESIEAGWDKLKEAAKETFIIVATPVMHELQKEFPKEYEELVVSGQADVLVTKMVATIQKDLGALMKRQLELYCPGKEEKDLEDGLARDTEKFDKDKAEDLDKKLKEMIATVSGEDVHGLIESSVAGLKSSYAAEQKAAEASARRLSTHLIEHLEATVKDCETNYKQGLAAMLGLYAVHPKWMEEFGHLQELYQTFPPAQHKHVAMLYLRTTALADHGTVVAAKDTASYADLLPAVLSVVALSVFGVAFFGRRVQTSTPQTGGWAQMRTAGADDLEFAREDTMPDTGRSEVRRLVDL